MPVNPTATTGIVNPYQGTTTLRQNIVENIDAIDPRDTPLLAAKGWSLEAGASMGADSLSRDCIQQTYQWQNDQLVPNATTLGAAYTSGDATMTLATGTAAYFKAGEVLVIATGASITHFRILSVPATGDVLSVEVLNGAATHVNGSAVQSLGVPRILGRQADTEGTFVSITLDTNFTQIWSDTAAVTGTEMATESIGIPNRLDREAHKVLQQLVIKLEADCIYGFRIAALPTVNAQPASRMGGLDYFIRSADANGITTNAAGARLSSAGEQQLKDMLDTIYNNGGKPDTIMVNNYNRRDISAMLVPFVRTDRNEGVAGVVVGQYEYSYGVLNVLLNRYVRQPHAWVLTMDYIGVGPLRGNGEDRSFAWYNMPKDGDYERRFVLGEYTLECRNRTRGHGLIYNTAIAG